MKKVKILYRKQINAGSIEFSLVDDGNPFLKVVRTPWKLGTSVWYYMNKRSGL